MPDQDADVADALMRLVTLVSRQGSREVSTTALMTMAFLADEGPQRITDLAQAQGVTQPTMTVLIANLESSGYAVRRKHDDDGRVTLACLTEAGLRFIADQRADGARTLARLIADLPGEQRSSLGAALPALVEIGRRGRSTSP